MRAARDAKLAEITGISRGRVSTVQYVHYDLFDETLCRGAGPASEQPAHVTCVDCLRMMEVWRT